MVGRDGEDDLYAVLGVQKTDSLSTIRNAYRQRAVLAHPDKGGNADEFQLIQQAYAVLSNPERRKHYDATGRTEKTVEEQLRESFKPQKPQASGAGGYAAPDAGANSVAKEGSSPDRAPPAAAAAPKKVVLPKNLAAALAGHTRKSVPIRSEFELPVSHVCVSERPEGRSLKLISTYPNIEGSSLASGEILVQMSVAALNNSEVHVANRYQPGEFFGSQGVGQVRQVGPDVETLKEGDWVLPLQAVDDDGVVDDAGAPVGTARTLVMCKAQQCVRLTFESETLPLKLMGIAKSIVSGYRMLEQYASQLQAGDAVVVNAANGIVGQTLIQMCVVLKYRCYAVVRRHENVELTRRRLKELGASEVFVDADNLREVFEETKEPAPLIAFDAVGGDATARIATLLHKNGDLVCFGTAGGATSRALPSGWGKRWKGQMHTFSFDEWLQEDSAAAPSVLDKILGQIVSLIQSNRLKLEVREFTVSQFSDAVTHALRPGRHDGVVLMLPSLLEEQARPQTLQSKADLEQRAESKPSPAKPSEPPRPYGQKEQPKVPRPVHMSWDFLVDDWDVEEDIWQKKKMVEESLFKEDPMLKELRIQTFVDDALATPVAMEIGARKGEASAVLFWLHGAGEVPEEHGPWLNRLAAQHRGLRILALKPKTGHKWFPLSDHEAVQLGLRFSVMDDFDENPDGEGSKLAQASNLAFGTSLEPAEVDAVQQVESAAIGLARRAVLEERHFEKHPSAKNNTDPLPFFFAGTGQGGSICLFTALCCMARPIRGVAFCHSGVPCGHFIGKRMSKRVHPRLFAVYDRADREVPIAFPEALHAMFKLLNCDVSLEWLYAGDGHDFYEDAAAKVSNLVKECLSQDLASTDASRSLSAAWRQ